MTHIPYLELERLVEFFYCMDYNYDMSEAAEEKTEPRPSLLQFHARMFALGDQYDISALRDVAVKKYSTRCVVSWDPAEFLTSIHDVYAGSAASVRSLRDAACTLMRKNLPKMLDDKGVAAIYEEVVSEIPDFTKDMLGLYVKGPLYGDCGTCGSEQVFDALQVRCRKCGKGSSGFSAGCKW